MGLHIYNVIDIHVNYISSHKCSSSAYLKPHLNQEGALIGRVHYVKGDASINILYRVRRELQNFSVFKLKVMITCTSKLPSHTPSLLNLYACHTHHPGQKLNSNHKMTSSYKLLGT